MCRYAQHLNEVEAFVDARVQSAAEQAAEAARQERQRLKRERLLEIWNRREEQRIRQYQKQLPQHPADLAAR